MITNETLRVIKQRRSNRSFCAEQITDDELQAVLEAGQYAPHAGDQAWHFTVVQNRDVLERLNRAATETALRVEMGFLSQLARLPGFHCLHHAPTLIIVSGDERAPMPLDADCAAANENMLIAAESLGLGACWVFFVALAFGSPEGAAFRKELKLPEGYQPKAALVLGYKQDDAPIPAPERKPGLVTIIR
ncbi:MAG: nitroreductase family protein [Anaerolineales bacterium]|nr:nitroreductase family protein [Anaerolineales bacterium]